MADLHLHVVHLTAEYWPVARTGGLAEAVRGLATHQARSGMLTSAFVPLYRRARARLSDLVPACHEVTVPLEGGSRSCRIMRPAKPPDGPGVYFVENAWAFDRDGIYGEGGSDYRDNHLRFALFARAVLEALPGLSLAGDIVLHPHDWHAALTPAYLRTVYAGRAPYDAAACVLSVHNAGFQGLFGRETLEAVGLPQELWHWKRLEYHGQVNWLKGGLAYADRVVTVSPTHAHELRTVPGGFGLHDSFVALGDRLAGILNGIDQGLWDPATDPEAIRGYSRDDLSGKRACKAWLQELAGLPVDPHLPLVGVTARLARQKGFDLILGDGLLYRLPESQFIFLGEGDPGYRTGLERVVRDLPDRVAAFFQFTEQREHRLLLGADILLLPSQYEPCGLTQMRAQRYGALPVVRRVGGLVDTVADQETGFMFDEYTSHALEVALRRAFALYPDVDGWQRHMRVAMLRDFSWGPSARRYLDLYKAALRARRKETT